MNADDTKRARNLEAENKRLRAFSGAVGRAVDALDDSPRSLLSTLKDLLRDLDDPEADEDRPITNGELEQ
jgi:hypothetical protein